MGRARWPAHGRGNAARSRSRRAEHHRASGSSPPDRCHPTGSPLPLSSFLFHRRFPLRIPGAHFHQQQLLLQPQGAAGGAGGGSGRLDAPGLVAPIPTRRERLRGAGAARGRIQPAPNRLDGAQGGSVLPARIPPPPQVPAVARPSRRERSRAVPGDGWIPTSIPALQLRLSRRGIAFYISRPNTESSSVWVFSLIFFLVFGFVFEGFFFFKEKRFLFLFVGLFPSGPPPSRCQTDPHGPGSAPTLSP